jgi:hypothetical protein
MQVVALRGGMFAGGAKVGSGSYFFKASASTFMGEWEGGAFKVGKYYKPFCLSSETVLPIK